MGMVGVLFGLCEDFWLRFWVGRVMWVGVVGGWVLYSFGQGLRMEFGGRGRASDGCCKMSMPCIALGLVVPGLLSFVMGGCIVVYRSLLSSLFSVELVGWCM